MRNIWCGMWGIEKINMMASAFSIQNTYSLVGIRRSGRRIVAKQMILIEIDSA